ncbi:MAG: molybdopterin-dependent oxidoreductase, partial [Ideonella sp.]
MIRNRLKVSPEALSKRRFMQRALGGTGAALLGGCDRMAANPSFGQLLSAGETLSLSVRKAVGATGQTMAQEFSKADLSPSFRGNGNTDPDSEAYKSMAAAGFADWKLIIDGLVEAPTSLTLASLRAMPSRTQITRHDCVEGWSAIGQWTGVQLSAVLDLVKPRPAAKYVVFHCADSFESAQGDQPYYESIDMQDARHPQTLLAYGLNDQT